jgi:hypothetical protein
VLGGAIGGGVLGGAAGSSLVAWKGASEVNLGVQQGRRRQAEKEKTRWPCSVVTEGSG